MRIIISPAKKMNIDTDSLPYRTMPDFLLETSMLFSILQEKSYDDLKKLWKCNDSIAALNYDRLQNLDLYAQLTPAILAYEGIQYQYMAPSVFTQQAMEYIQEHLRILSGFYGIVRPFDGIVPYRLEMQAKLSVDGHKNLYSFWGDKLARKLCYETDCIINLASKEYSACISAYLPKDFRFITCTFAEEKTESESKRAQCARWPGEKWYGLWQKIRLKTQRIFSPYPVLITVLLLTYLHHLITFI